MGNYYKVKFWPNERFDLPDAVAIQEYIYQHLGQGNNKLLSATKTIISGFVTQNNGGTDIKVEVKDSSALNTEGTTSGLEGLLWTGSGDISIDPDLTATLTNNITNYIEIEFFSEDSGSDTRAFWDPTANAGEGDEFNQVVNTCTSVKARLKINTIAFTGNPNYIPISRVVTSGGAITNIYDERPLFFRLVSDYAWPDGRVVPADTDFSGADKSITQLKEWMDAVMTTLKEIKGVEWYETIGSSSSTLQSLLQDRNIILSITGGIEFNKNTGLLSWDNPIKIIVPDESFDFSIPAGNITLANGDLFYVIFDRTGTVTTLATNQIANGSLLLHKDYYVIGYREGGVFVLRDGRNVAPVWVYEESEVVTSAIAFDDILTLPLDSRDSNAVKQYKVGRGELQFYINGIQQNQEPVELTAGFQPTSYTSGTGIVVIPDGTDLSKVRITDIFRDVAGSEFSILGDISNVIGAKQFRIETGQTVNVSNGAYVVRKGWSEEGTIGTWSNTIKAKRPIPTNAVITYRIEPLTSIGGGASVGGGGGGASTLQDAYNGGRTIIATSGNPVEIFGPVGQKLFKVNGDIDITGIIDPIGITFTPQATTPISGQNGIWFDDLGNLKLNNVIKGTVENLGESATANVTFTNSGASTILKGRVVRKTGQTTIYYADWTTFNNAAAIGISLEDIASGNSGEVQKFGFIPAGVITSSCFVEAALPSEGSWVYLANELGKLTVTGPSRGTGFAQLVIGIWDSEGLNLNFTPWGLA